ncbi:hypothetical protein LJB88_05500, partial [Erysipelotrichaceae bacterium OttesenSCG-928-M19]|nr:hypothetical protein [Erysipelotrichaceae bacterium OttesenSCG-928-M19]
DLLNNKISPQELITSSLEHIKAVNDKLNAVNSYCEITDYKIASTSYLAGIPFAMKDLVATKDILTTSSSKILEDFVPVYNATIYEKLLKAEAKMIVKTNLDEFGMGGLNINSIYGRTYNPYNIELGTGGSSGGSAALVAAGCIPYAIGTDTGDSVRLPAALCGIYGYKPTWTLISRYGVFPYASSLDHVGFLTRSVDDIAILMEELNGPDENDTTTLINEKTTFFKDLKINDSKLKIGYIKELIDSFDNELVLEQFNETISYLKSLGHDVIEVNLNQDLLKCNRGCYHVIANAEATSDLADLTGIPFGKRVLSNTVKDAIIATRSNGLSKYSKIRLALGAMSLKEENKAEYYLKAKQIRTLFINEFTRLFNEVDILVSPASNTAAYNPHQSLEMSNDAALIAQNHLSLSNIIGAPSITIPTHFDSEMLPYAMSFMAKPFADQLLLNFSKQFENGLLNNNYLGLQSFYNVYAKEVK